MSAARNTPPRILAGAALVAVALAALLAVPAASLHAWGVNGLRSVPAVARLGVVVAALGLGAATGLVRSRAAWIVIAAAAWIAIAFPLRESIHWLGDTSLRLHAIASAPQDAGWNEWRHVLHAAPLDAVVGYSAPRALSRLGGATPETAVSAIGLVLALLFTAGAWRLAGRIGFAALPLRAGVTFLIVAGALECFAGYAESAGVFVTALALWLAEALDPRPRPWRVVRVIGGWLLLTLVHRMALLLAPALLLWAARPPGEGSGDRSPRLGLAAAAIAAGMLGTLLLGTGRLQGDWAEWLAVARAPGGLRTVGPADALDLIAVTCPLVLLVPPLLTRSSWRAALRSRALAILLVGALPLIVVALVQPVTPSGLGVPRDWDLATPAGLLLGTAALVLLAAAPPERRALAPALVAVVALVAGSWLAVNASIAASTGRAVALAYDPAALPPAQRSHLFTFLGERAESLGEHEMAASLFDEAFTLTPNPRRAILAARAWAEAGNAARARRAIGAARARGLSGNLVEAAEQIEASIRVPGPARDTAGDSAGRGVR